MGSILGLERCPGGGHGNNCSILAWKIPWLFTKSQTRLKRLGMHTPTVKNANRKTSSDLENENEEQSL